MTNPKNKPELDKIADYVWYQDEDSILLDTEFDSLDDLDMPYQPETDFNE